MERPVVKLAVPFAVVQVPQGRPERQTRWASSTTGHADIRGLRCHSYGIHHHPNCNIPTNEPVQRAPISKVRDMSPKSGTKKIMGGGMLFFDYNLEKTYLGDGILERYVAHLTPLIGLPMWLGMATAFFVFLRWNIASTYGRGL